MFAECTIQYDTKKWGDIYVFVEKQILVIIIIIIINIIGEEGHWSMTKYLLMSGHILHRQITVKSWIFWQFQRHCFCSFIFTTFWANSANDKLVVFLFKLFFQENKVWLFMQTPETDLHEIWSFIYLKVYFFPLI